MRLRRRPQRANPAEPPAPSAAARAEEVFFVDPVSAGDNEFDTLLGRHLDDDDWPVDDGDEPVAPGRSPATATGSASESDGGDEPGGGDGLGARAGGVDSPEVAVDVELVEHPKPAGSRPPLIDVRDETVVLDADPRLDLDFWAMYDEARAVADLLDVPPTSTVAVVGPLEVAMPAARRSRSRHWINDDDVFVLTTRPDFVDEPSWNVVDNEDDLVAVLNGTSYPTAMLVIDVPDELPRTLPDLIERLRDAGLALVRYVIDGDPSNEDLATWHGVMGRPAVLDLAGTVKPARVLELLDRAEPVASIAGVTVSAELILALRMDVLDHR